MIFLISRLPDSRALSMSSWALSSLMGSDGGRYMYVHVHVLHTSHTWYIKLLCVLIKYSQIFWHELLWASTHVLRSCYVYITTCTHARTHENHVHSTLAKQARNFKKEYSRKKSTPLTQISHILVNKKLGNLKCTKGLYKNEETQDWDTDMLCTVHQHTFVGTLMYIACLFPSFHFYAIPILHFKFQIQ